MEIDIFPGSCRLRNGAAMSVYLDMVSAGDVFILVPHKDDVIVATYSDNLEKPV